ncbi:MAG: helix-turn-helix domain-containing protein [Gemmatimonadales bacterium]
MTTMASTTKRNTQFDDLKASLLEMRAIERGETKPSRQYTAADVLGAERVAVIEARKRTKLSQVQFAKVLDVSVRTLQEWEQGRRAPTGAARTLIRVAARYPKEVLSVTRGVARSGAIVKPTRSARGKATMRTRSSR